MEETTKYKQQQKLIRDGLRPIQIWAEPGVHRRLKIASAKAGLHITRYAGQLLDRALREFAHE